MNRVLPVRLEWERATGLARIYRDVDGATAAFARSSELACPDGCGRCCVGFMPDSLPVEAEYAAHYLIGGRRDLAARLMDFAGDAVPEGGTCPFYLPDSGAHCAVYPARPLVCRLFGFSAARRKDGEPAFRPCRHMPVPGPIHPRGAPIMSDAGTRLWRIEAPGATRQPFPALILRTLDRLLLHRQLRAAESMRAVCGEGRPPARVKA